MRRRDALRAIAGSAGALALSTGCGGNGDGRVEAPFWFAYGGKNREVLLSLVEAFHHAQPTYRLRPTFQGDYFEALAKLRAAIAVGAAPALTHVLAEVVPYLADAGVLAPLDEVGSDEDLDLVPELGQRRGYAGGDKRPLIALPFNRSTPICYFNRDLFRELGLQPPTTWDELRDVARKATARDAKGEVTRWGFECPIDWWFWLSMLEQAGGSVVGPDNQPTLGGDEGVRALELWQKLVHEDRAMRPPPGRDYNSWQVTNADFVAGRAAMIWNSTAFLRYLEENARFSVGAARLPAGVRAAVTSGGTMFVVPKGTKPEERAAAFAFLRFMMQPAQANEWATRTGYIPVSRGGIRILEERGYYREHPNDRVAIDQLAVAEPWPWAPNLFRIEREAVQPRLEEAVLSGRDARALMDEARRAALEP